MREENHSGMVVNIQDYSVHDGYGIRTLVFLKGCPMHCPWCQNPESIDPNYEIKYQTSLCIDCLKCREVCPADAILEDKDKRIDRSRCNLCMRCVESCPSRALSQVGKKLSVDEIMKPILSYKPFYDSSDRGGITLSGGEPTFQAKFSLELLKKCKEFGIHTAMETCGFTPFETLKSLVEYLDLLLFDIKHMDDQIHQKYIGVSNQLILENLKKIIKEDDIECVVRIPLITGFNENEKSVKDIAHFVRSLGIKRIDLLPFNDLPSGKYKCMGHDWEYKHVKRQPENLLKTLKKMIESNDKDICVTIGGLW